MAVFSSDGGILDLFLHRLAEKRSRLVGAASAKQETEPEQKLFQRLFSLITFPAFILAGLDFRFGWTRQRFAEVPLMGVVAAQIVVVAGYWLVFRVMKTNTFAAGTIQVEIGQTVISSGPYARVRHPMYTGMAVTALAIPLALGSYVTLPVFALMVPVLVYRLVHEEKTLRRNLPGYTEYCQRTRFRLVLWVW
jgi:protein-S-isoprenylcysteine O-methyltransferase Ste14